MNELAKVRARHDDIPQDALPGLEDVGAATAQANGIERAGKRTEKSIAWAVCPHHAADPTKNDGRTGLVAVTRETYAFRQHTKRVGNVTVPCPGSGLAATPEEEQA